MKIECSECNDLIETTATTVVSPYICDDCRTAAIFQDLIAPAALAPEQGNGLGEASVAPPDSTEATTQIIVDLEQQIAQGSELIADMKSQLDEQESDIDLLLASNLKLYTASWQLRNSRDYLSKALANVNTQLADALRENEKQIFFRKRLVNANFSLRTRGFWARVFNSQ